MSFRSSILIQLGILAVMVDLDSAVASAASLPNVCLGDVDVVDANGQTVHAPPHIPTAIKQQNKCPDCTNTDKGSFKKARKVGKQFIVVDLEEVAQAKADAIGSTNTAIHLTVHPAGEVHLHTIHSGGAYSLKAATQGMVESLGLLTHHIKAHPELAFVCEFTPAGRSNHYELVVFGDTLVLEQRCRTEDLKIVQMPLVEENLTNLGMLDQFLPTLVAPYDPALYHDKYLKTLDSILATKVAQDGVQSAPSKSTGPKVVGAMDLSSILAAGLAALKIVKDDDEEPPAAVMAVA